VHRETEEARAIATELAQRTAQARVELEAELKTKRDDSEQEALHMYQNAVAQAQQITDEANANFAASAANAAELVAEAERISREANQHALNSAEEAQRKATSLLNLTRRRAEDLTRKAEGLANNAIKDSEERLSKMRAERIEIEEFLSQLRNLMSTEAMVAEAENTAETK
jgi:hypothetical protein